MTMAGHTFWSSLIFSVLLLSPGFILQKCGTSTITFTHEHWTADIGAGGPGFLSFEAFHSFVDFNLSALRNMTFAFQEFTLTRLFLVEYVQLILQMELFSLFVRSRKKCQGHCFERNG